MNVEIINTSNKPIPSELEEALEKYAPYHNFGEQRNRIGVDFGTHEYVVRGIFVKLDEEHIMIWVSDWYVVPRI
jgi:hypothetical protein